MIQGSPFLSGIMRRFPHLEEEMKEENYFENLLQSLETAYKNHEEIGIKLRIFRLKVALYIGLRDLNNEWSLSHITQSLTLAAEKCVQVALAHVCDHDYKGLFILSMGKMGAGELNYSSDIDLIALYDPTKGEEAEQLRVKRLQRFVKILQERTSEGYVFRVDLRLRPDPSSTPIALATPQALAYYAKLGQTWERSAHIKAKVIAGDFGAGEAYLKNLESFVWRKYLDLAAVQDIHEMKQAIHAFKGHEEITVLGHNLKLGRGGIREIEFFVQSQQLIGGGRNPTLRGRETLQMLDEFVRLNWVQSKTRDELQDAYIFLRTIEHRLQMVNDEQTHSLPTTQAEMKNFVLFAGFKSQTVFEKILLKHLKNVEKAYSALFQQESLPTQTALDFNAEKPSKETLAALKSKGFKETARAYALIHAWHSRIKSPRARQEAFTLLPLLLHEFGKTGQGNEALNAFDRLITSTRNPLDLLMLLRRDASLPALFALLLGTSPRLSQLISRRVHVLDGLFEPAFYQKLLTKEMLEANLKASLDLAQSDEEVLDRLRIFNQEQSFLISVKLLTNALPLEKAGDSFSQLAEIVLQATFDAVLKVHHAAHGLLAGEKIAIVGFGKLGSREMNAASDIDFILLYEGDDTLSTGARPLPRSHYFARFMQRFITALSAQTSEGKLYDVDTRLRPSGRSGPLATAFQGFITYQQSEAEVWERLALTRARVVVATLGFEKEVSSAIKAILQKPMPHIYAETLAMRRLIAKDKGEADPWQLKYAKGGLIDIEFITQALQAQNPKIAHPHPLDVLEKAKALLSQDARETLIQSYCLQSNLMQLTRLCVGEAQGFSPALQKRMALSNKEPDFQRLEAKLLELQLATRSILTRFLTR
jgi:[glutamine synthetase] adenylyltransferase / [glutamine synthetase]-adenylyl-L-tyrosine phosphorylase